MGIICQLPEDNTVDPSMHGDDDLSEYAKASVHSDEEPVTPTKTSLKYNPYLSLYRPYGLLGGLYNYNYNHHYSPYHSLAYSPYHHAG